MITKYSFYEVENWTNKLGNHMITYNVEYNGNKVGVIEASSERDGYVNGEYTYKDNLIYTYSVNGSYNRDEFKILYAAKYAFVKEHEAYMKNNPPKQEKAVKPQILTEDFSSDFYPTPSELAGLMIAGINDKREIRTVLEPSAGKGNLVECLTSRYFRDYNRKDITIDCIEKDKNLQYILNGKGFKVIHDDFLTYGGVKQYDLIFMNPPFSEGCTHLLKAISMQKYGGQICCLLNAETLKNPYTKERQILMSLLNKYHASIKYIENAFKKAERRTDAEIAVIWIDIAPNYDKSTIFEGLKNAESETESSFADVSDIVPAGFVEDLIAHFNTECKLCREFIREYNALKPYIMDGKEYYSHPFIELKIAGSENKGINECIRAIRSKYWNMLLNNSKLTSKFTYELQRKYSDMIDDMKDFDFTLFNIEKIIARMNAEMIGGLEEEIYRMFDKFSATHSYGYEGNDNIHYFNGWKTNKAWKVGMKAIIPAYGVFSDWKWDHDTFKVHEAYSAIADIEKCLNYLNGKPTLEVNAVNQLEYANRIGKTRKINLKYFSVTYYKKGTVHIVFHKEFEYLIDALNIFVCKGKGWLPPSYGKKKYDDMTQEEQTVIDDFQGKEKYDEVLKNKNLYIYTAENSNLLMLEAV